MHSGAIANSRPNVNLQLIIFLETGLKDEPNERSQHYNLSNLENAIRFTCLPTTTEIR